MRMRREGGERGRGRKGTTNTRLSEGKEGREGSGAYLSTDIRCEWRRRCGTCERTDAGGTLEADEGDRLKSTGGGRTQHSLIYDNRDAAHEPNRTAPPDTALSPSLSLSLSLSLQGESERGGSNEGSKGPF